MSTAALFDSPWPAEDGGPARLQTPRSGSALALKPGESLRCTSRSTLLSTMTVLGAPGEVFLLTHSALRAHIGLPTTACVERIDPVSLKTVCRSPRLPGGPMWPGGMAVHGNGDLYVVYGRYAHRLNLQCDLLTSRKLPVNQPYNSFVVLANGLLVTKNLSKTDAAVLSVLDPDALQLVGEGVSCPEPSVARLSAVGNTIYVVGVRSIFRYHWDEMQSTLALDHTWRHDYATGTEQSFGWDVVLDGQDAWFMDNGDHRYRIRMMGAGVKASANRLIRVSLTDAADHQAWPISGVPCGSITNPPLIDVQRQIVVAFDSANSYLRAWRFDRGQRSLQPLWEKHPFGAASHMILYPGTGELVVNDYRRLGEEVCVLNIETGAEHARVRVGGLTQGVVFPSPGWGRDFYWSSMGRLAHVVVE